MELTFNGNNAEMFQQVLVAAVKEPGTVLEAFRNFHNYSFGNSMLALWQMRMRDIKVGPIAPYKGWQKKGRQVKRGAKAISLLMPVKMTKKVKNEETGEDELRSVTFGKFIARPNWFALSQTYVPCSACRGKGGKVGTSPSTDKTCEVCKGSGENPNAPEYVNGDVPNFDFDLALKTLKIVEVPFEIIEGNTMGYAQRNEIAVNPLDEHKAATRFHEIAHIMLGHTKDGAKVIEEVTRVKSLKEVEAEAVALLCLSALGIPGAEFCRSYIQGWLRGAESIPVDSAQKIMVVADRILKAGTLGAFNGQEREI